MAMGYRSAAVAALRTDEPKVKAAAAHAMAAAWRDNGREPGSGVAPDRPARPDRPVLTRPGDMPKRRALTTRAGQVALLHALAHIEFNAIDLACDMIARFDGMPPAFYGDWIGVADDEARHFQMLRDRLHSLDADYGDLAAHDGLWQAADDTRDDLLARLAVVPLVLEARGLDVTPAMIARLKRAGDHDSVAILEIIYREEIDHVAAGSRWFRYVCEQRDLDPEPTWRDIVRSRFKGALKPPFNEQARQAAGLPRAFYEALSPSA